MTSPRMYAGRIYFALCFAAFAAVTLVSAHPPLLRDYPDWVYQGVLLARTLAGHPVAGYALKHYPVPNSITTVGLALLTLAFGWMWAAKLWLAFYLGVEAVTIFVVARVFSLSAWLWWALPAILFFGQGFWFATVSFSLGTCTLLLLLCLLYQERERVGPVLALVLLCFFLHFIIYVAAALLVLLYCLHHRRWKLTYLGLATLPLPLWYFLGRRATPSNETALGYSPPSHLAVPAVVALIFLGILFLRPGRELTRSAARVLSGAAVALCGIVAVVPAVGSFGAARHLGSVLLLARLKLLTPFQPFGFVNIIYAPVAAVLRSGTLALFHRPVFVMLMVLDVVSGLMVMFHVARMALARESRTNGVSRSEDKAVFIWHFVVLFGLLYLTCPPNALGVISIDARLAQLALAPALLLLGRGSAQRKAPQMAWVSVPSVLLLLASLYQFRVSQRVYEMPTADVAPIPRFLAYLGAADPTATTDEYDRLCADKLEGFIFATGVFYQTIPWQRDPNLGR